MNHSQKKQKQVSFPFSFPISTRDSPNTSPIPQRRRLSGTPEIEIAFSKETETDMRNERKQERKREKKKLKE